MWRIERVSKDEAAEYRFVVKGRAAYWTTVSELLQLRIREKVGSVFKIARASRRTGAEGRPERAVES